MSEETTEKRKVTQPFNIKLYPDEIDRFKQIKGEMDNVTTDRGALIAMMDFFENPKTVEKIKDNPVLVQRVSELEAEVESKANEITVLRSHLDQLQRDYNESGETGTQLQLEIDRLKEENEALKAGENHSPYFVGGKLHPVVYCYLQQMAEMQSKNDKKERSLFWILSNNFIQDLQNPLSNHLPMIVSSEDMRKKLAEYKKSKEQLKNEE